MSRNGSGVYSLPAGYEAVTGETILATQHNSPLEDLAADANVVRPVVAGGTGVSSASLPDTWTLYDPVDSTKKIRLDAGSITTGTTRVITMGDADVTLRPQAEELIYSGISSGTSFTQTGLSAYRVIYISGRIIPATDNQPILVRTSTNNGSTYDSGTGYDYAYALGSDTAFLGARAGGTSAIVLSGISVGNAADEGVHMSRVALEDFNQAAEMTVTGAVKAVNQSGNQFPGTISGTRNDSTARDALQLFATSGNISWSLTITGVRS